MAEVNENIVPFADGRPVDGLQVEPFGEDEVLIGDPELDQIPQDESDFDDNLAETIDGNELMRKASNLVNQYETDESARDEWKRRYEQLPPNLMPVLLLSFILAVGQSRQLSLEMLQKK